MEKLAPLIHNFISTNLNALLQEWEKQRQSVSIWHNGPIDDKMPQDVNNIVQSFQNNPELQIRLKTAKQVDLVVNSFGGYIEPAYQTIRMLDRTFKGKEINFVVPRFAKSAATLLACGCDKIVFSQIGELGPLDVQIRRPNSVISGITINRLIEDELKSKDSNENMKEWIYKTLKPEEVLEMKRFNEVAVEYLKELLPKRMFKGKKPTDKEVVNAIANLCDKLPSHGFVIDYEFAKDKLLFNVEYVSKSEEIILQNVRELWDYAHRLEQLMALNVENKILKKMVDNILVGKYER